MGTAEKAGLDGKRTYEYWYWNFSAVTNAVNYFAIGGAQGGNTTEANRTMFLTHDVILRRIVASVSANGKNGATVIGVRAGGSTVASISVSAGATHTGTSAKDSGALNIFIAKNTAVAGLVDTSASSDGLTLTTSCVYAEVEVLN